MKPPPGSKAADATALHLGYDASLEDWAFNVLLPRAQLAKTFCDGR